MQAYKGSTLTTSIEVTGFTDAVRDAIAARTPNRKQGDAPTTISKGNYVGRRPARDGAGAELYGHRAQGSGLYLPKGLPGMPYDAAKAFTFVRSASTPS